MQGVSNNSNNNEAAATAKIEKKCSILFGAALINAKWLKRLKRAGRQASRAQAGRGRAALPATRNGECEWRIAPAANYCASLSLLLLLWHSHVACTTYPGRYKQLCG